MNKLSQILSWLRKINKSNTWWDNQDYHAIKYTFLRDNCDGVEHPSRQYLRNWLVKHPYLKLLDVACGPGVEYEGFIKYQTPVNYLGMDFSNTILQAFKERYPEAKLMKAAIQKIPLKDNSVDVVLCRHILEHLPDYRPAIKEAIRVAKTYVFIVLFRLPTSKEVKKIGWGSCDNRLDIKELKTFLNNFPVKVTVKPIPYQRPTPLEENTIIMLTKTPKTNILT